MAFSMEKFRASFAKQGTDPAKAPASYEALAQASAMFISEINRLKERVKALESAPQMTYLGVWRAENSYRKGEFVTDHGSLWHCNVPTGERPGSGSAWTLAVKRGSDR